MKMADGGTRPAYNVQFATDTATGVVVGVEVNNAGTDGNQLPPMLDQLEDRYDHVPDEALVDGGFATVNTIEQADARGCTVYAPLKNEKKQQEQGKDPYARKKGDSECGSRLAEPDGDRGSQADLSAAGSDGGVGQRAMPQPGPVADAGAGTAALSHHRIVVCDCS